MQPCIICIKYYNSNEENEGDTTFLVEDPLDSPSSSSSTSAKVNKDIITIGRRSKRNNLGQKNGRSIDENEIGKHGEASGPSYM